MAPELRAALHGLYPVTQDDMLLPRLSALAAAALRGGVGLIQYRNKHAPSALRRAQAAELLRISRAVGTRLIVNDHLALALEIGADGVHLGGEDGDFAAARAALGPNRILGISCYDSLARAEAAVAAGADYIAFGAMYVSSVKPHAVAAPLELLTEAKARFGDRVAIAAIGGITLENAPSLIAAGADMLAVITDLFEAMDITARAHAFQELFTHDHA